MRPLHKHYVAFVGVINFDTLNFFEISYFCSNPFRFLGSSSVGKILIGIRETLSIPLNLIPVSICLLSPYIKFHFILNKFATRLVIIKTLFL